MEVKRKRFSFPLCGAKWRKDINLKCLESASSSPTSADNVEAESPSLYSLLGSDLLPSSFPTSTTSSPLSSPTTATTSPTDSSAPSDSFESDTCNTIVKVIFDSGHRLVRVNRHTTCREIAERLLLTDRLRMRHRDPNLFYFTMDVKGSSMMLGAASRPAEVWQFHPWRVRYGGECTLTLRRRSGVVVRVGTSVLVPHSNYRCLIISEKTTAAEVVTLLLRLHEMEALERSNNFYLTERCSGIGYERRVGAEECPAEIQKMWTGQEAEEVEARFQLRMEDSRSAHINTCGLPFSSSPKSICQEFSCCNPAETGCFMENDTGCCEIEIRNISDISIGQDHSQKLVLSVVDSPSPAVTDKDVSSANDDESDAVYSYV